MKTKQTTVKGFTLVELIVVMAIFSGILFGCMKLIDPVAKIFQRTSNYESTATAIDNMRNYLEGNIGPVEFLNVYSVNASNEYTVTESGTTTTRNFTEIGAVRDFMDSYHLNRVSFEDGTDPNVATNCHYDDVTVNVIKLDNGADGKISKREYIVNSLGTMTGSEYHVSVGAPATDIEYAVNKAYYTGADNSSDKDDFSYEFQLGYTPKDAAGASLAWVPATYDNFAVTIRAFAKTSHQYSDGLITDNTTQTVATIGLSNIITNIKAGPDPEEITVRDESGNPVMVGGVEKKRQNIKVKGFYTARNPGNGTVDKVPIKGLEFKNLGDGTDAIYLIFSYRIA